MVRISYPDNIQAVLNDLSMQIKQELNPELILVAGSLGKGSWLYDGERLLSDFEIVFVCRNSWSVKQKRLLQETLNREYSYDISLKGFLLQNVQNKHLSNYSKKNPGYLSLSFFDTFKHPQIIYSKHPLPLCLPEISNNDIPAWEAWRLYVNRIGELFENVLHKENHSELDNYYWLKIFEATADAILIVKNFYSPCIYDRSKFFHSGIFSAEDNLSDLLIESFGLISSALYARLYHDISLFKIEVERSHCVQIINEWMCYFQKQLFKEKRTLMISNSDFLENYMSKEKLHKIYLEENVVVSNLIRLMNNPGLINLDFKYYNLCKSWRHIILLSISSLFYDKSTSSSTFDTARKVLSVIVKESKVCKLSNDELIAEILKYWKKLR